MSFSPVVRAPTAPPPPPPLSSLTQRMEGTTAATCEVEATDVVRVVLQFLKENGLTNAMLALQDESQVALNTVDNLEAFVADVQHGRWDAVMSVVATLKLPMRLLQDLYEQIVVELLELRELDTALRATETEGGESLFEHVEKVCKAFPLEQMDKDEGKFLKRFEKLVGDAGGELRKG